MAKINDQRRYIWNPLTKGAPERHARLVRGRRQATRETALAAKAWAFRNRD